MKKKVLAVLLVSLFVLSVFAFTGCANNGTGTGGGKGSAEVVNLTWFMGYASIPTDNAIVEEKLNEMSTKLIGVTNNTVYLSSDDCKLAMTAGDPWDMAFTCEWYNHFTQQAPKGYFADLEGKVQEVAPELWASMPAELWKAGYMGDKLYAIPVMKDYAAMHYWRFDKALVEELDLDYESCTTFESIEPIFKAIKDAKNVVPFELRGDGPSLTNAYDMIFGEIGIGIPYAAQGGPDENKIVCVYDDPLMISRLETMHEWFQAGYINLDAATNLDPFKYSPVKFGQGFYGADSIWKGQDDFEQLIVMWSGPYLSTASVRGAMNGINADSENIDAALKYQQMVNTDVLYRDTLRYGIEGTHWNYMPEDDPVSPGTVQRVEGATDKYAPWPFSQGSYMLSTPEYPAEKDMWDQVKKDMEGAVGTNGLGFVFDMSPVEAKVAACKTVRDGYFRALHTGTSDPAVELPKMMAEFKNAGIDDVLAECQKQFDAYVAAN